MSTVTPACPLPISALASPELKFLPGLIVIGAVCFNAGLAIVNGNLAGMSQAPVVVAEILFVALAHAVALANYRREMAPWYALLGLFVAFALIRSLSSQTIDVRYLRDVMIIPTFVVLGLTFDARRLALVFVAIQLLMVVFLILEAVDLESYSNLFKIKDYYINTRGYTAEDFWNKDSQLYVSATRPDGSFLAGLGRSARLCMDVLGRSGYGVTGADVSGLYNSDDGVSVQADTRRRGPPQVSIYHLNPPMLLPGILRTGPRRFLRTFNVGYWAWELETLPREWIDALAFVDAVMVPSTFCRRAVERHTPKPVLVVPHPVPLRGVTRREPTDGVFRVISIFNFGSSFERKNPVAAIRAFRAAFETDEGAELVLKVSDGARYPAERARLSAEIGDAANVTLVDVIWDEAQLDAFMASADAYLSLHRSEGYGLTLAEAIAAGVPVVATNWSGNVDFCHPDLCFPVDFDLVPARDGHLCFDDTEGAVWAEPSVAHAAVQLRRLREARPAARARAALLRDHLRDHMASRTYEAAFAEMASADAVARGAGSGMIVGARP